jgi:myo-inositol-1(or 4)-monophosphatase
VNHVKKSELERALTCAEMAGRAVGRLMRANLTAAKKVNDATQHDIKLELDVRCQRVIERILGKAFPGVPVLGEEGITGDPEAAMRWVVDPIDGTVNFTYGIPHACVSIALQKRIEGAGTKHPRVSRQKFQTVVGLVYDPFCDELWTAISGQRARLNGEIISVSHRRQLREAIVALGFAKGRSTLNRTLPVFNALIHRVRKIRIMGAAALSMVYVASGRMDAYIEYGLRLWDIAAGGLILECAGGDLRSEPVEGPYTYRILASNGLVVRQLQRLA